MVTEYKPLLFGYALIAALQPGLWDFALDHMAIPLTYFTVYYTIKELSAAFIPAKQQQLYVEIIKLLQQQTNRKNNYMNDDNNVNNFRS